MVDSVVALNPVVGLLVVHGIGHQKPGSISRYVLAHLSDTEPSEPSVVDVGPDGSATTLTSITVGGQPVVVCEANWSAISQPDNPPCVRDMRGELRACLDTVVGSVSSAGHIPELLRPHWVRSLWLWQITILGPFVPPLIYVLLVDDPSTAEPWSSIVFAPLAFFFLYSVIALCRSAYLAPLLGKWSPVRLAICVPVGLYWYMPIVFWAGLLLMHGAMVLFAVGVNVVCRIVVRVVHRFTAHASRQPLRWMFRWVNRVTWVMVVMPCHSLGQVVKAAGNLLSILVWEHGLRLKALVIAWAAGILLGFVVLLFFNEIVLLVAFAPLLVASRTADIVFGALWLTAYLAALRFCLPAIDLLLDVGNYHLAPAADRSAYAAVLDRASAHLAAAGCREVHVLAHSLGTVIMYDWLKSGHPLGVPVTVLHTIGSPLNKFWFVDHGRNARAADRNGLGDAVQHEWINYWAASDPVSGALRCYDAPSLQVRNERLRWLGPWLVSHTAYWRHPRLLQSVRTKLVGGPSAKVAVR